MTDSSGRIYAIHVPELGVAPKLEVSVAHSFPASSRHDIPRMLPVSGAAPAGPLYIARAVSIGGWEVTVALDADQCDIYCIYRRKRDSSGRTPLTGLLLPPITAIQIQTDFQSKPILVIADPAGLGFPAVIGNHFRIPEQCCLPGRRLITLPLQKGGDPITCLSRPHLFSSASSPEPTFPAAVPLRV
jgi:hypothetical protein